MIRRLTAIDVFSGCGGLSLGLTQAGFDVIGAIELDARAASVYVENHPKTKLINQDVRAVAGDVLLTDLGLERGQLDLLAGCPPCQGFSRIRHRNKGLLDDERNALIDEFARLVKSIYPKTVMMENVEAIVSYSKFTYFLECLSGLNYHFEFGVLDAASYGVAQRRRRLILLASLSSRPEMASPSARRRTVKEAIGNLPRPGSDQDSLHNIPEKRSHRVKQIIELVPVDGGSRKDLPSELKLSCHSKSDGFSDVYGRMAWGKPSPTITSGCTNPSKGRFIHPQQNRCITLREAALLQGFPKQYKFDPKIGKEALALMIGNALPPPFVRAHALALKRSILAAE